MRLVYHPRYLFGSRILNRFHPFRFDRARTALGLIRDELGTELDSILEEPKQMVTLDELLAVHSQEYLDSLKSGFQVALVLEVPWLGFFPRSWVHGWFLHPTLWSTAGSLLAARLALSDGIGFSLGGGFHHAKPDRGEGFCLVSDIAYSIHALRKEGLLGEQDLVYYIDLDVHQGNGVSTFFAKDPLVRVMDVYNEDIYPRDDREALEGVDVRWPLKSGCEDEEYLEAVEEGLKELFDLEATNCALVIYNAGTDIFEEDALGCLALTREGVNKRDQLVLEAVRGRGLPLLVLASGGYSDASAQLVADFALAAYRYRSG